jgi:hypothetical protein
MKLTSVEHIGRSQLIPGVVRTMLERTVTPLARVLLLLMAATVAHGSGPSLSVALAIPSTDDVARIVVSNPAAHFHVILHSQSASRLRIWNSTFSWGYYALSFQLLDDSGVTHVVRKTRIAFSRNIANAWLLEPDDSIVLDVFLGRPDEWEGLPVLASDCRTVQMTAIYEVVPDAESMKRGVWTGRVVSRARKVSLCK